MSRDSQRSSDESAGFVAGVVGAAVATMGMLAISAVLARPSPAELIAEGIAGRTPVELIDAMVTSFGSAAKGFLFASVLVGELAVGGALGMIYERRRWTPAQGVSALVVLAALLGLVLLPLFGAGALGASTRAGAGATLLNLSIMGTLFAAGFAGMTRFLNPQGVLAVEDAASRRRFLRNTTLTAGGLILGVSGIRWIAERLAPPSVSSAQSAEVARTTAAVGTAGSLADAIEAGVPGLSPEITPNDEFYVVSKNVFRDPVVNEQSWSLEIAGLIERPMVISYEQVRRLPSATQYFTLQCISNEVGGELVGNAEWRGVWLADLLRQAGVRDGAVDVVFHAADDYTDTIPLAKALQPGTMVAYEMNGEILPTIHGFPARLLIPDIYGMKNVKWVTKIEVIDHDLKGYWQNRGWSDVATMNTTSRIDAPKNGSFLRPGRNYIGGIAVAGQRGIRQVDVSSDGARTWAPATMKPALGPNAWVLWLAEWDLPASDVTQHKLLVRATDGDGAMQVATVQETLPDGATGYHAVVVRTAEG
ncbi:MAG: molybdopterin-dependent oxidoreductase [Chloroflexi bacterium]|nr:molybdopterin-dependent oxidoreductase [Chloroflexota bacterium]